MTLTENGNNTNVIPREGGAATLVLRRTRPSQVDAPPFPAGCERQLGFPPSPPARRRMRADGCAGTPSTAPFETHAAPQARPARAPTPGSRANGADPGAKAGKRARRRGRPWVSLLPSRLPRRTGTLSTGVRYSATSRAFPFTVLMTFCIAAVGRTDGQQPTPPPPTGPGHGTPAAVPHVPPAPPSHARDDTRCARARLEEAEGRGRGSHGRRGARASWGRSPRVP